MNRREFSVLVGGAAARWAQQAAAQQQNAAPGLPAPRLDWLARHKEPILEPGLPIIDPHHHLWQRPGWRYLLDDLLMDTGSGHNIVATVYMEASSMYRDRGPEEMRPVGEVEFANGVAAMCGSGVFGKNQGSRRHRWARGHDVGQPCRAGLERADARGGRSLSRDPPRRLMGGRGCHP